MICEAHLHKSFPNPQTMSHRKEKKKSEKYLNSYLQQVEGWVGGRPAGAQGAVGLQVQGS